LASPILKMPLQPWVQETVTSTMAEKARHRFQTPWSIHWELAEGPLQGALTPHQKLSLIRDHEAAMEKHLLHLHGLADNVRTCEKCNRRQIMTQINQDCPSCLKPGFTVENQMSIGPSLTQEACLAVRV
jgi:rubrerythrin